MQNQKIWTIKQASLEIDIITFPMTSYSAKMEVGNTIK